MNVWMWGEGTEDWELICYCERHPNAYMVAFSLFKNLPAKPPIRVQVDKPTTPPTKADILVWGEVGV